MNDAIRTTIKDRFRELKWTQIEASRQLGLREKNIQMMLVGRLGKVTPTWQRMLDEMGFDLVIVPREKGKGGEEGKRKGRGGL